MPEVPRYGQRQVAPAPLPAPSGGGGGASVSAAALGAGYEESKIRRFNLLSDIGSSVAGAGFGMLRDIRQEQEQATAKANQYALLKADNQLSMWENARLYDPNTGVLATRGEASFPLPEIVQKEYGDVTGEIAKGLGNEDQRLAFETVRLQRGAQLDHTVRAHVLGEMQQARGKELEAFVENTENQAAHFAGDPRAIAEQLGKVTTAIQTHGPDLGMGHEQITQEVNKARTAIHASVIGTLIDQHQVGAAQAYYDETKDQINGDAIGRIEAALKAGDVAKQAQHYADGYSDPESGLNLTETLALLRDEVKDPEVRVRTQQLVEHNFALREKAQADQAETTLRSVYNLIDKTPDVTAIPTTVWATLSPSDRSSLRNYAAHLAAGTEVETDLPTYYGLMQKAGTNPNKFARENLLQYRADLGKVEFKQLSELQLSIRNGEHEKAAPVLDGFRTRGQIVDDTLVAYGIDPNAKPGTDDAKAIAALRRMLDVRVDAAQLPDASGKPKKLTNQEIQQTLDTLLSQKVTVPGSWWNIWPGGKSFTDTSKRVIDLSIDDVPAPTRSEITTKLKARGLPVTDETVLSIYRESLVK